MLFENIEQEIRGVFCVLYYTKLEQTIRHLRNCNSSYHKLMGTMHFFLYGKGSVVWITWNLLFSII